MINNMTNFLNFAEYIIRRRMYYVFLSRKMFKNVVVTLRINYFTIFSNQKSFIISIYYN